MANVTIHAARKQYTRHRAVNDVNLCIDSGELLALLGPSGCGKTTLLRLIAGFERLNAGHIAFDGTVVASIDTHVAPEHRRVGMVFQSYALWPHMSVENNVGYPLRVRGVARVERAKRVAFALGQVGMADYAGRRPADLSGGQRQRVALARCLVMEPAVVLLDEPLANLDVHLREAMQAEFRAFHEQTEATMVYVTHDQAEAMALADRIAVMNDGTLEQVAPPSIVYQEPASAMVAEFVGRAMVFPSTVDSLDGDAHCHAQVLGATVTARCRDVRRGAGQICLRAEQMTATQTPSPSHIPVTVRDFTYRGPVTTLHTAPHAAPETVLNVNVAQNRSQRGDVLHIAIDDAWCLPNPAHPTA